MKLLDAVELYEECDGASCRVEYMDSNGYGIVHDKTCSRPGPRLMK